MSTTRTATQPAAFHRADERGTFMEVVSGGPWETVITGRMHRGAVMGNHYHKLTRMFFFVVEGEVRIDFVDVETGARWTRAVGAGRGIHLEAGQAHAIRFMAESQFVLLKSRRYNEADPDTYPFVIDAMRRVRLAETGDAEVAFFPL